MSAVVHERVALKVTSDTPLGEVFAQPSGLRYGLVTEAPTGLVGVGPQSRWRTSGYSVRERTGWATLARELEHQVRVL